MRIRVMILIFVTASVSQAQVYVSGNVSGTWGEQDSLYYVVGDVTVPEGQSLTILPGVEVRFMDHYRFTVQGGISAEGTAEDSIKFVYYYGYQPGAWWYIEFDNVIPGTAVLNYCLIESGDRAADLNYGQVTFNHCRMQGFANSPIYGEHAQIFLNDCVVTESGGSGLYLRYETSAILVNCEVTYHSGSSGHGINADGVQTISVAGGYIGHNAGRGVYCLNAASVALDSVSVAENGSSGIHLLSCDQAMVSRVAAYDNGIHGILLASTMMIAHNLTVSSNGADGILVSTDGWLQVSSSIIDHNAGYGVDVSSGTAYLAYNDAYMNTSGNYLNCSAGTGSIEEDPLYVSLISRDFHLLEGSPCIDAGSPTDPEDPDGTTTDMGAYFYDQSPVLLRPEPGIAQGYKIISAYPNPFNPTLNIVLMARQPVSGVVEAWTAQGRLAAVIWQGQLQPGNNELTWHADSFASGMYYIHMQAGGITDVIQCLLIK